MIVVVFGLPGSGKSYFASRLAVMINAEYWNSDRLRKELFPKRTYSDSEKAMVYEAMVKKMEEVIDNETNLVLDATFHQNSTRAPFIAKSEGRIIFIAVEAEENIIKERLKQHRPFSEADLVVYQQIKEQWEPLQQPHLILQSTNDNIDEMLQNAIKYLKDDKKSDR